MKKRKKVSRAGDKKSKRIKSPEPEKDPIIDASIESFENNVDLDGIEENIEKETETTSSVSEKPIVTTNPLISKPSGYSVYGRLKVKVKSSKLLESQHIHSDIQTQSDTDKSSVQMVLEKGEQDHEKMEDSANSNPQMLRSARKTSSIKIKTSKSSDRKHYRMSDGPTGKEEKAHSTTLSENGLANSFHQDRRYNQKELITSLAVIKKIMKMDAAEPFNAPVNPIALGIPDYFDIIENPMDFGTICNNLESGTKYMNSEDVFRDVQFIWENCYKYNNKGDYIIDLMKRVKKNFMKYWTGAGLYCDAHRMMNETIEMSGVAVPNQDKLHSKGSSSTKKARKRHGIGLHKSDCLCAVCVVKRRRKEREENAQRIESHVGTPDDDTNEESKEEESVPQTGSENMNPSSEIDHDDDLEDLSHVKLESVEEDTTQKNQICEDKREHEEKDDANSLKELGSEDATNEDSNRKSDSNAMDSIFDIKQKSIKGEKTEQEEGEAVGLHLGKHEKSSKDRNKTPTHLNLFTPENILIHKMCKTLFPNDPKSFLNGPHSLIRRGNTTPAQNSALLAAVEKFMK